MLQVIISPAKQMQVDSDIFAPSGIPPFPAKTERLVDELRSIEKERGSAGLKELWRVNDALLAENIERLHEFICIGDSSLLSDSTVARHVGPALFSYVGIQYRSMAPDVLGADALDWLQGHLWVLSALYGCVRPFDAVQPYRLEMAAKMAVGEARNLYAYWGADIARAVCQAPEREEEPAVLVNLASAEYAKAVLPQLDPPATCVTCVFGEGLKNGKPVQRATASKIARGSMVRWMAERGVESASELERFDVGYTFFPELSVAEGPRRTLVFMRS
ncbi:MAG: YaaA family protein [Coriobacteriaceae bacterium]|nr:YaaA family protein [Coriobacteriaceae bacterium]